MCLLTLGKCKPESVCDQQLPGYLVYNLMAPAALCPYLTPRKIHTYPDYIDYTLEPPPPLFILPSTFFPPTLDSTRRICLLQQHPLVLIPSISSHCHPPAQRHCQPLQGVFKFGSCLGFYHRHHWWDVLNLNYYSLVLFPAVHQIIYCVACLPKSNPATEFSMSSALHKTSLFIGIDFGTT